MSIFTVYNPATRRVILETDDWVEAEWRAHTALHEGANGTLLNIRGTHPSHDWSGPREHGGLGLVSTCANCGGYDNGSYGSHAPCGYDFSHDSLVSALERERAQREKS
jgi:hypothetical protein